VDFVTDNGNWILDIHNMDLVDPVGMEQTVNNIPGVVSCGLFALRPADLVLVAGNNGVEHV
jgi:ribose 5-phosphate isomerase A